MHLFLTLRTNDLLRRLLSCARWSLLILTNFFLLLFLFLLRLFSDGLRLVDDVKVRADEIVDGQLVDVLLLLGGLVCGGALLAGLLLLVSCVVVLVVLCGDVVSVGVNLLLLFLSLFLLTLDSETLAG